MYNYRYTAPPKVLSASLRELLHSVALCEINYLQMNIIITDNGTLRLEELTKLLKGNEYQIVNVDKLDTIDTQSFDLAVLSGSSKFPIFGNESLYKNEVDLIKTSDMPIIGICLGFELICYAYGAKLEAMDYKKREIVEIQTTQPSQIFDNLPNFRVYKAHRWVIKDLPAELVELARSNDGVEVVKHKKREIYGFQFHPEMLPDETCGDEIFNNLLSMIRST